jgi:hypothetical protein
VKEYGFSAAKNFFQHSSTRRAVDLVEEGCKLGCSKDYMSSLDFEVS